jgi:hypothetical protein
MRRGELMRYTPRADFAALLQLAMGLSVNSRVTILEFQIRPNFDDYFVVWPPRRCSEFVGRFPSVLWPLPAFHEAGFSSRLTYRHIRSL